MKQHLSKADLLLERKYKGWETPTLHFWTQQKSKSFCFIMLFTKVWKILKDKRLN